MELQFHKNQLSCLQRVKRETQSQEQTQEIRLGDGMPDIGRVLGAWGQVLMRGKEWRSGGMSVSGGVMVWVLYAPEDGGELRSVEGWIPFQMKWELPDTERDGTIRAACLLRGVDARSTSARKLMVRANVSVLADAYVPGESDIYTPQELPEDIHILKHTYPMLLPKEAGEKPFEMDEELTLPASAPRLAKIVRFGFQPEMIDRKIMADKMVFRGAGLLHILYRGEDEGLYCWDFELPFSQYTELDTAYEQEALPCLTPAVTSLELDVGDEGRLHLKAGMTCQYMICDRAMVEVVEDAYSPRRSVTPKMESLCLPMVLEQQTQTIRAEQTTPADGSRVADVAFYPDHARPLRNDMGVDMELNGQFQMLYYDNEGRLQSVSPKWSSTWSLPAAEDSVVEAAVSPSGTPQATIGAGGGELRADLLADAMTTTRQGLPMVCALEMGELTEADPGRPSLILRKAGNDRLWDIAKCSGSTVEAIREANRLVEEPNGEQILLIPVS